jgi:hypothetical protein
LALSPVAAAQNDDLPRTPSGHPDLSGTYDVSTLTPMQRPTALGEKLFLTDEEAAEIAERERSRNVERNQPSDPDRGAPPQGGDGSPGAAGNVGGYNSFWLDRGNGAFQIDGQWRTSILIDPPNGRFPPASEERIARRRGGRPGRPRSRPRHRRERQTPVPRERRHGILVGGRSGCAGSIRQHGTARVR